MTKIGLFIQEVRKPTAKFGSKAQVCQSLISNGSIIAGSVTKCVISPGVHIHPNAIVRNSVIMNDTVIEEGCIIDGAIIDKNVVIGKGSIIGRGKVHCPNEEKPNVLSSGLNVIGKGVCIPEGTIIERNVRIFLMQKQTILMNKSLHVVEQSVRLRRHNW